MAQTKLSSPKIGWEVVMRTALKEIRNLWGEAQSEPFKTLGLTRSVPWIGAEMRCWL